MTKDCSSKWRYLMAAIAVGMLFANLLAGSATAGNVLITVAEAAYPDSVDGRMATRSGSFGPEIELVTPTSEVRSPFPLKINFIAKGSAIDAASFKLLYLKSPMVDLTDRVTSHLSAKGIVILDAEVPPGTHVLRLHLKDTQGRMSTKTITFIVAKQ